MVNPILLKISQSQEAGIIRDLFTQSLDAKNQGKNPINLAIGDPSEVAFAYHTALEDLLIKLTDEYGLWEGEVNPFGYVPNPGLFKAREVVARYLSKRFGPVFPPDNVFIGCGATHLLSVILQTHLNPELGEDKEEVIISVPYFMLYNGLVTLAGGKPIFVKTTENFDLDVKAIEDAITPNTRIIIINSPNNPTGKIYHGTLGQLTAVLDKANKDGRQQPIVALEDCPYDRLVHLAGQPPSMIYHYIHTLHVNSFSKTWGIAGERLGYFAVYPLFWEGYAISSDDKMITQRESVIEALSAMYTRAIQLSVVNAPRMQQEILIRMGMDHAVESKLYKRRIDKLAPVLEELGFKLQRPDGGFYIWAELPEQFDSIEQFNELAYGELYYGDEPLFVVPGSAFGMPQDSKYVRIAVCVSNNDIERACSRFSEICNHKVNT